MNWILNNPARTTVLLFIFSVMLISGGCKPAGPGSTVPASTTDISTITAIDSNGEKFYPEMAADYVVFRSGNNYYAVNGHTGKVDRSGDNATMVLQDTIDNLSEGFIWIKNIPMPTGVKHKNYVTVISTDNGQLQFYGNFGHTPYQENEQRAIIFNAVTETSKPIIEWRDYQGHKVAWIVAHYKLDDKTVHQHISIETSKADMNTIITRFQVTYGQDIATVKITNANLEVLGQLYAKGAISLETTTISQTPHDAGENDCVLLVDAAKENITINLVTAAGNTGRYYMIKKVDSSGNFVIVVPHDAQKIDGSDSYKLSKQYSYVQLVSDGANWFIVGGN
jgi:hypothetical protein